MPGVPENFGSIPLLTRLPLDDVRALASGGRTRTYSPGTVIFREGGPGDSLHVVVEGSVRITRTSREGDEATIAILHAGECFGEMALLDGGPRSANAIAAEPVKTFVVTREQFRTWLLTRPAAAVALLETLSLRLRRADDSLVDRFFLDIGQRLAKVLLERVAAQPEDPRLRVTQAELASTLGVTRESVNKQLAVFAREGWVKTGRGSVTVLQPEALAAMVTRR